MSYDRAARARAVAVIRTSQPVMAALRDLDRELARHPPQRPGDARRLAEQTVYGCYIVGAGAHERVQSLVDALCTLIETRGFFTVASLVDDAKPGNLVQEV